MSTLRQILAHLEWGLNDSLRTRESKDVMT
jgi:hypothetical protein